jgi:hypothetical protein
MRNLESGRQASPKIVAPSSTLSYARHEEVKSPRLSASILLGILQFFWITFFVLNTLGWNRPVNVVWDSFYYLLTMAPSIVATLLGFSVWRRHFSWTTRRHGAMIASLVVWVISGSVSAWLIFVWFTDVLLDPHGRWCPL